MVARPLVPEAVIQPLRGVALGRPLGSPSLPSGPLTGAAAVSSRAVLLGLHPGLDELTSASPKGILPEWRISIKEDGGRLSLLFFKTTFFREVLGYNRIER